MQSQHTQVLKVKIASSSSKRRKKDCSKLSQGSDLGFQRLEDSFLFTPKVRTRSGRIFKTVGFFCAVAEEAVLELCDASCVCSVGRKRRRKEAERAFACLPGH